MNCPKCGSNNIFTQQVADTKIKSKTKGFGCIKACLGYLLFSLPGILCGLCGMGKSKQKVTTTYRTENICQNCGHHF